MHNAPLLMRGERAQHVRMHVDDAAAANIVDGDVVRITSPHGEIELPVIVTKDIVAGVVAVPRELDLEFQVILPDGNTTDRAGSTNARPSPRPIRLASGKLSIADRVSGLLAEKELVWHLAVPQKARRDQKGGVEPDARGLNARSVNQGSPMEGELSLPHQVHDEHGGRGEPQGGDPEVPPGFGTAV